MSKKPIKKISVKDADKKRPLVHAYNEKCFWVYNGPALSNLADLLRALTYMTDEQFSHHVTKEKNDFARWVAGVLLDTECAKALMKAGTVKRAVQIVERRLQDYSM